MLTFKRPQFIVLSSFVMSYGLSSAGILIPLMAKEHLGASAILLGSFGMGFNLLYIFLGIMAGRLHKARPLRFYVVWAGLLLTASSIWMAFVENRYAVFGPCLLWGLSSGFFWPAIEAAASEGQTPEGIKRGLSWFSVSWVTGALAGLTLNGWIYGHYPENPGAPFWLSAILGLGVSALALAPGVFDFAPWREGRPHQDEKVPPGRRRLFVRLAFQANFAIWVGVATVRILLPEYAKAHDLTGLRYSLLMSALMVGFLISNTVLTHWHGWHYSPKILIGGLLCSAAALLGLSVAQSYPALLAAQIVFGMVIGLTYFSSLYYGMAQADASQGHSGHHEAIIGGACAIGPLVGGWIIYLSGWDRSAFPAAALFILALAIYHTIQSRSLRKENPPSTAKR